MSLLFSKRADFPTGSELIPERRAVSRFGGSISDDTARRHSTVWACLRLRADLISTLPLDVFRKVDGVQVEVKAPDVITKPGGNDCLGTEWRYSSQIDLDSCGNFVGGIGGRDSAGKPIQIEPLPADSVTIRKTKGEITYQIGSHTYQRDEIWHEKQYTLSGLPYGLSPLSYAANSIGQYLAAQQFSQDWFDGNAIPSGHLKNMKKTLNKDEAQLAKERFKQTIANRDIFVSGADWEFNVMAVKASDSQFIEALRFGAADVCRFLGVPASAVDAENGGAGNSLTYSNITQADLHLLVRNLAPSIARREEAFSTRLVAAPRFVKFNTDALLRMDPQTRQDMTRKDVEARLLTNSEARALMNRPPLTPTQVDEFNTIYPTKQTPQKGQS